MDLAQYRRAMLLPGGGNRHKAEREGALREVQAACASGNPRRMKDAERKYLDTSSQLGVDDELLKQLRAARQRAEILKRIDARIRRRQDVEDIFRGRPRAPHAARAPRAQRVRRAVARHAASSRAGDSGDDPGPEPPALADLVNRELNSLNVAQRAARSRFLAAQIVRADGNFVLAARLNQQALADLADAAPVAP